MILHAPLWTVLVSLTPYIVFLWFVLRQRRLENQYNAMRQDWLFPPATLRLAAEKAEKAGDAVPIAFAFCTVGCSIVFLILNSILA